MFSAGVWLFVGGCLCRRAISQQYFVCSVVGTTRDDLVAYCEVLNICKYTVCNICKYTVCKHRIRPIFVMMSVHGSVLLPHKKKSRGPKSYVRVGWGGESVSITVYFITLEKGMKGT